jgi:hypothetical protein
VTDRAYSRVLFGTRTRIAGTVYGTIVVMATVAAGAGAETDPWQLALLVFATVVVLWIAHVYAHALAETVERGRRLDLAELTDVARRDVAVVLAATGPIAALVLGALGVVRESRAIWLALVFGLVALAVQGVRYARIERLNRTGTLVSVAINLGLGLVIVALKAAVAH